MLLLLILIILYLFQSLFLFWGIVKSKYRQNSYKPIISVIVAARNEANNILNCLNSLAKLNYPSSKIEIIIVNDRSDDDTGTIIMKFIKDRPSFKYIQINEKHPYLSGKAGAISQAIKISTGEIIFVTDADCTVPQNWLTETVTYFTDKVGIVAGFTLIKTSEGRTSLFGNIQALDWLYLLSVAAGAIGWKIPLSCVGNNFAFKRQAYEEVGGYEGVGFSLTEDFALLQAVSYNTDWQVAFPMDFSCLVYSKPIENIRNFFSQRKRWASGGLYVRPYGKFIIGLGICTHLSVLINLIFSAYTIISFIAIAIMIIADLILIIYSLYKLHQLSLLIYYFLFKPFYCCYLLLLPILILINKKIVWKDITYLITKK